LAPRAQSLYDVAVRGARAALRGVAVSGMAILLSSHAAGCKDDPPDPIVVPAAPPPPPPAPPGSATILAAPSFSHAVELALPLIAEGGKASREGTALLAEWADQYLAWETIDLPTPETTLSLAARDLQPERGKRLCETGEIKEIFDEGKVFTGLLYKTRFEIIGFIAVRSVGKLEQKRRARFCGVVTGRHSSAGPEAGSVQAVQVIGMFDVPENKKPPANPGALPASTGATSPALPPGQVPYQPAAPTAPAASSAPAAPTARTIPSQL
jgi:hypothetical protein